MKSLLAFLGFVYVVFMCTCTPVSPEQNDATPAPTMKGYLESDTGEIIPVIGQLVSSEVSRNASREESSATYEFIVDSAITRGSGYSTLSEFDGAYAVKATVTIYYTTQASFRGDPTIVLTRVSGGWTRYDSTVRVTAARLSYGCKWKWTGSTVINQSVGSYFNIATGFNPVNQIDSDVGANLHLTIQMGQYRRWYLYCENNV